MVRVMSLRSLFWKRVAVNETPGYAISKVKWAGFWKEQENFKEIVLWLKENCQEKDYEIVFSNHNSFLEQIDFIKIREDTDLNLFRLTLGHKYKIIELLK